MLPASESVVPASTPTAPHPPHAMFLLYPCAVPSYPSRPPLHALVIAAPCQPDCSVAALQHRANNNINNTEYSPSLVGSGCRTGEMYLPVRSWLVSLQFDRSTCVCVPSSPSITLYMRSRTSSVASASSYAWIAHIRVRVLFVSVLASV